MRVILRSLRHDAPGAEDSFSVDTNQTFVGIWQRPVVRVTRNGSGKFHGDIEDIVYFTIILLGNQPISNVPES